MSSIVGFGGLGGVIGFKEEDWIYGESMRTAGKEACEGEHVNLETSVKQAQAHNFDGSYLDAKIGWGRACKQILSGGKRLPLLKYYWWCG